MNDDFEDLLRAEFASRAGTPFVPDDRMADAAISGARRIRRWRRVAAGAGGLGLLVLGAAVVMWNPLTDVLDRDPTIPPTSADEVQRDLDVEFVAERGGEYGVLTAEDDFVPLPVETDPLSVFRVQDAYLIDEPSAVTVMPPGGGEGSTFQDVPEDHHLGVNSQATSFTIATYSDDVERQSYRIHPTDLPEEPEPITFELSYEVTLQDWSDDVVVVSADLFGTTGGEGGQYYFEDQFDWGLDSIGTAGYESAVVLDWNDPSYMCVSDLEPGFGASESEECGDFGDQEMRSHLRSASGGAPVTDLVERASADMPQLPDPPEGGELLQETEPDAERDGFYDKENVLVDPGDRWAMSFDTGDETWAMIEFAEDGSVTRSSLTPPEGALRPVQSYI
ncbi:hypothetical protein [Glycomyces xiaoerkulensis]|uniref:hypothetical protein n=1 Tax=Glycomyces xiaoerkulensis TaxID=2038139 RepID=UPI000C267833|nr:hypothetical protein [Glycomyces xiaoerkulensis]